MKNNRYPGIRPFSVNQSNIFFGRDEDIERLYKLINVEQLLVLFSKSGFGKSSLINAGIIPLIQKTKRYNYYSIEFKSGLTLMPLDYIKEKITSGQKTKTFLDDLFQEPHSLWHLLKNQQITTGNNDFLFFFDQFEQLFSYPQPSINNFKNEVAEIINTRIPEKYLLKLEEGLAENVSVMSDSQMAQLYKPINVKIVMAIRSDKMSPLHSMKDKLPNILNKTYELLPLNEVQAHKAVMEPAALEDKSFSTPRFTISEDAFLIIKTYLTKGGKDEFASFQLQAICQHIEEMVSDKKTSIEETDLGDLSLVFKNLYDNIINTIEDETDKYKVRIFIEDGLIFEEDKRRQSLYEGKIHKDFHIQDNLLDKLVESFFIKRDPDPLGGISYELAHDSLVGPILESKSKRLKEEEAKKNRLLIEEKRKEEEKKRKEENEQLRQKQKRTMRMALISVIASFILVFVLLWALVQRHEAVSQKNSAEKNEYIADRRAESINLQNKVIEIKSKSLESAQIQLRKDSASLSKSYLRAEDLNIRLTNQKNVAERLFEGIKVTRDTLLWQKNATKNLILDDTWLFYLSRDLKNKVIDTLLFSRKRDTEYQDFKNMLSLASLGKIEEKNDLINALSIAKLVRKKTESVPIKAITESYVKNICFPKQIIVPEMQASYFDISSDGKILVYSNFLSTKIYKLRLDSAIKIETLRTDFNYGIKTIHFIHNSNNILITGDSYEQPSIYDLSGKLIDKLVLEGNKLNLSIEETIMDENGKFVVFCYSDESFEVYNFLTGKDTRIPVPTELTNLKIQYTASNSYLLFKDTLFIQNIINLGKGYRQKVISDNKFLYVSPDDNYVITSRDNNIYKTNLSGIVNNKNKRTQSDYFGEKKNYTTLTGHTGPVSTMAVSYDRGFLASGSEDKTIRIWDMNSNDSYKTSLIGQKSAITQLEFVPDKEQIISLSEDGNLFVWNFKSPLTDQENILNSEYIPLPDLSKMAENYLNVKNDTNLTIECYRLAAEIYPASETSWYDLGYAYIVHKLDTIHAINSFRRAYKKNSQYDYALNGLGLMHYYQTTYDSALYYLNLAIHFNPDFTLAYRNRADVYLSQNKISEAAADYNYIIKNYPYSFTSQLWNSLGNNLYNKNAYKEAIPLYKQSIVIDTTDYKKYPYYNLGLCYKASGNTDQALESFQKVIKIDPDYQLAWYQVGELYRTKSKFNDAVTNFIQSFRIAQNSALPLKGFDSVFYQSRDTNLVLRAYKKLLDDFHNNSTLLDGMARFQFRIARYDSAVLYAEKYNEYFPGYYSWFDLGWYRLFVKDFEGAIAAGNKALTYENINKDYEQMTLINMAHAYLFLKEIKKAEEIYNKYKNEQWGESTIKNAINEDFKVFCNAGLVDGELKKEMERISRDLNNEK